MKNFLITGGAGFIGSTVAEKLLNNGDKVVVVDNFNDFYDYNRKIRNILEITNNFNKIGEFENLLKDEKISKLIEIVNSDNFTLIYGDIRDRETMDRVFAENSFDLVFNPAAMAGVRPSLLDPMLYEDVNVRGYMNLLELCKKYGVKKFVQASSSSVYGNNKDVYEIFNLGESHVVSLKEMVETIENALGKKAILDIQPMQPGDVDKTYADISKAKSMIGYDPQTNFSEGIRKFVEWYKR